MMRSTLLIGFVAGCFCLFAENQANAQFSSNTRSVRAATRNFLYNRPTVSPYLNLTTRDAAVGLPNYHTLVRPRIEAEQQQIEQQRQTAQMQQQLHRIQEQYRQVQQQSANMMMTGQLGWSSRGMPRFGSYLNFYPGFYRIPR